jgi:hypothetical protein
VLRLPLLAGALAALAGAAAAWHYAGLGLTLSHYDAKAHLVVSRRIFDSLTPGWEQVGAVWLPLPHLVNMLPVQIDYFYRTGLFAIALSIASHAVAAGSIAATVLAITASRSGGLAAAALYTVNPNVLYLQSTPMTEPMLFALSSLEVCLFTRWIVQGVPDRTGALPIVMVLACLTRYEAWPITAACLATSALAWWRRGRPLRTLAPVYGRLVLFPIGAVIGFALFSRMTVGEWFVSGGFFVPDETLRGQPDAVLEKIEEGMTALGGAWLLRFTLIAAAIVAAIGLWSPGRAPMLVALSLFAAAALPFAAYMSGHPFRMRYQLPLVVGGTLAVGMAVGLLRRLALVAAVGILGLVLAENRPFATDAAMVLEAQLDRRAPERRKVTECLKARYRDGPIMVSMGALAHYMHEMSADGFAIRDFLHEGNGPLWDSAFTRGPAALVEWVLVEEEAEGGDAIVQRFRATPSVLDGFERICAGGGVALFQRKGHGVSENSVGELSTRAPRTSSREPC